jgi:hypothetical protein
MSDLEDIVAAGLGFRRADDFTDWLARESNAAFEAAVAAAPKPKTPRLRKPNVRALIEAAERSGKHVSAVTVAGVKMEFGTPEPEAPPFANPWDQVYETDQKRPS